MNSVKSASRLTASVHEIVISLVDLPQGHHPPVRLKLRFVGENRTSEVYCVSFFKTLTDSTGHAFDACQGAVEVSASTENCAIQAARLRFAKRKDVSTWSLRADYEKAELLPARRRTSSLAWRRICQEHSTAH